MPHFGQIIRRIESYRKRKILILSSTGLVNVVLCLMIIWISTIVTDAIFYFSVPVRWFVLLFNSALSVLIIFRIMIQPLIPYIKKQKDNEICAHEGSNRSESGKFNRQAGKHGIYNLLVICPDLRLIFCGME